MAHLPRDGKGCEKDAAGRATCNGHYDAAKSTPGHQLLDLKTKNPAAPAVKREAEEDWGDKKRW
jgi:hypothetical protein